MGGRAKLWYMTCRGTAAARFSTLRENVLVSRVNPPVDARCNVHLAICDGKMVPLASEAAASTFDRPDATRARP